MAAPVYLRGASGIWTLNGATFSPTPVSEIDKSNSCRRMMFTQDGSLLAWCNAESAYIFDTKTKAILHDLQLPKVAEMKFSPKGNILVTWSTYSVDRETQVGKPNMHFFDVKTGSIMKSIIQKKATNWAPSWSVDEEICIRHVNHELHFYEQNNFNNVVTKLQTAKVGGFSLAPSSSTYTFAANFPGSKGQPSFVRLYNFPLQGALASKSFFKGDRVDFFWNKKGNSVLILTSTESSESSYYGEQGLHFLNTKGDSCFVPMQKQGPVYHVEWAPGEQEFLVMHGYMPCKATVYNAKCEPTFDFGTGAWNSCCFNPQGNILLLAGFGNLPGNLEFWDYRQKKMICKTQAPDSTHFTWCPDGQHLLTSTTSPRLRVGNGYRVWHYSGTLMVQHSIPEHKELWEAAFQPLPQNRMPIFSISAKTVSSTVEQPKAKTEAYRPPHARGAAATARPPKPVQEYEAPSNVRAASAKKQRLPPGMSAAAAAASAPPTEAKDIGKKKKNLRKRLKDIEKLKEQQAAGTKLDPQQEQKISQVESILQELRTLDMS